MWKENIQLARSERCVLFTGKVAIYFREFSF